MNENTKTISLVVGAVAVLVVAFIVNRAPDTERSDDSVGKILFAELNDPEAAKSMEITTVDENTGEVQKFKVAQVDGLWSLPSRNNYPADAKQHLTEAATALIGVKILDKVSDDPGSHELYGVIEPDQSKLKLGMVGVGKLVTIGDDSGQPLARLIIGKEDKAAGAGGGGGSDLRFVRIAGQDPVYVVKVRTDKFTTNFKDWIEPDFLQLNAWDIKQVQLNDYQVHAEALLSGQLALDQKSQIKLEFNDKDSKWSLGELVEYVENKPEPATLADDEELNATKLNEMKTALDDLKIIDVARKPKGLSANLKAEESIFGDPEAIQSLAGRGFYPVRIGDRREIISNDGEVICRMKDGVEYVLRFGQIASVDAEAKDDEMEDKKGQGDKPETSINRYLMVAATFNEEIIAKPELEKTPEEADAEKTEQKTTEGNEGIEGEAKEEQPKAGSETTAKDEPKTDEAKEDEAQTDEAKKDDAKEEAAAEDDPEKKAEAEEAKREERKRIERENRRKQDEYDDKVKAGQKRVKNLNAKFADWYYVIPDDVYKKIHLSRADVIKKKAPPAGEAGKEGAKDDDNEDGLELPPSLDPFKKQLEDSKGDDAEQSEDSKSKESPTDASEPESKLEKK